MVGAARSEIYGPFEVLERLGMGGMATVHRAIERGIDGFERVVALKRLLPHLAEDVDFVRAFVREAKLASMLQHGNIVQLYELGRVGASYFISMEYIPGRDLRLVLRQARRVSGPPPIEISIALLTELLDALDYAHSQTGSDGRALGLVHRDISPANLIVGNTGHLKVIDFGIAKATFGHLMTHSGRIKGKLSYMAPEALAGRSLDGRSDLFSASIIAHELITANPLFAAKDDFQIIDRLQNMQPPAPSTRNPSCPAELDRIILRGLAKDPDKRWRSAGEMRAAIAELALDQRLLATNREVCGWVEEAFQHPAPVAQPRRRMPLAAPVGDAPTESRRGPSGSESEDDIMDIVWGGSSARSMPVVLDEVPDVSSKLPLSSGNTPPGPDLRAVHRSDASLILGSPSSSQRTGPIGMVSLGMGAQRDTSQSAWSTSNLRQVTDPTGWAVGTGPTAPQQSQAMLEEAMLAARRAEVMALAAMATRRRPLAPLLIASVAVTAAGAAVAWFITNRDRPHQVASAGQGAQVQPAPQPVPAAQTQPPPAPPAAQGVVPPGGSTATPPPAPIAVAPEPVAPARRPADPVDEADDAARGEDKAAKRAKAKREAAAARERAKEEERAAAEEEEEARAARSDEKAAQDSETRGTSTTGGPARQTRTSDATKPDLAPLPVPVPPPVTRPAQPARPARASGPIVISSSRAQRESGNTRPIRFPPGEALPPKIVAKLCIDTRGTVTSVAVLSTVSAKSRRAIERGLANWRYKPVVEGGQAVAACFATAFPVQLD